MCVCPLTHGVRVRIVPSLYKGNLGKLHGPGRRHALMAPWEEIALEKCSQLCHYSLYDALYVGAQAAVPVVDLPEKR